MNQLLIFAKYPEPGKVKTRMAQQIGNERTALLYKEMVEEVVKKTSPLKKNYEQILCYDPPERENDFYQWFPALKLASQKGCNLGERMKNALEQSLTKNQRAVLIGSDCTEVHQALIGEAFGQLDRADLVLGPATDGGYYLIACKKCYPELFQGISWSTPSVFNQTTKKAEVLELKVSLLQTLSDKDTLEDLHAS